MEVWTVSTLLMKKLVSLTSLFIFRLDRWGKYNSDEKISESYKSFYISPWWMVSRTWTWSRSILKDCGKLCILHLVETIHWVCFLSSYCLKLTKAHKVTGIELTIKKSSQIHKSVKVGIWKRWNYKAKLYLSFT